MTPTSTGFGLFGRKGVELERPAAALGVLQVRQVFQLSLDQLGVLLLSGLVDRVGDAIDSMEENLIPRGHQEAARVCSEHQEAGSDNPYA